jgi:hypothetical protein
MPSYQSIGTFRIPPTFWTLLCTSIAAQCQAGRAPARLRRLERALREIPMSPAKDVYLRLDAVDADCLAGLLKGWLQAADSPLGRSGGYHRTANRLLTQLARAQQTTASMDLPR